MFWRLKQRNRWHFVLWLKIKLIASDSMNIGNCLWCRHDRRDNKICWFHLRMGEFSHICRGPMHTFQGGQFCVEYSCAHPLQSISELMRCDAAPLSCRNWFLTRTDCIFSPPFFLYLSFLSSPSLQLFGFACTTDLGGRLKGVCISVPVCVPSEGYHLYSNLTLHFLGFPFSLSLSDYTCVHRRRFCASVCETEGEKRWPAAQLVWDSSLSSIQLSCKSPMGFSGTLCQPAPHTLMHTHKPGCILLQSSLPWFVHYAPAYMFLSVCLSVFDKLFCTD